MKAYFCVASQISHYYHINHLEWNILPKVSVYLSIYRTCKEYHKEHWIACKTWTSWRTKILLLNFKIWSYRSEQDRFCETIQHFSLVEHFICTPYLKWIFLYNYRVFSFNLTHTLNIFPMRYAKGSLIIVLMPWNWHTNTRFITANNYSRSILCRTEKKRLFFFVCVFISRQWQ